MIKTEPGREESLRDAFNSYDKALRPEEWRNQVLEWILTPVKIPEHLRFFMREINESLFPPEILTNSAIYHKIKTLADELNTNPLDSHKGIFSQVFLKKVKFSSLLMEIPEWDSYPPIPTLHTIDMSTGTVIRAYFKVSIFFCGETRWLGWACNTRLDHVLAEAKGLSMNDPLTIYITEQYPFLGLMVHKNDGKKVHYTLPFPFVWDHVQIRTKDPNTNITRNTECLMKGGWNVSSVAEFSVKIKPLFPFLEEMKGEYISTSDLEENRDD